MPTLAGIGGYLVELALGKTSHGESTEGASQSNAAGSGTNKSTSTRFPRSLELSRGSNSKVSQRESDVDEIEEVHPFPGRRGGVKRGREQVDGLELPGAKRKAWPIEGERRLVGRDGAIPTEKMVGRPTYEGNSGLDSTGRRGKSIGRGFRPVDTLNKKYHASPAPGNRIDTPRRGTTSVNGHIVNPLETRKATDRSPMSSSMASNVQRESCRNLNPSNARADGSHIGPSLKKQKMEHLGSTNGVKSDPVDLTEPDDDEAVITAKVRRVVGPTAQSTSSRRSSPHHSSPAPPPQRVRTAVDGTGCNNAFANSNEYYKSGKPKNSRHRSGPRGTRNSSQTPSVISLTAIDGAGLRHSGNRAAPVTWEESESVGMESRPTGTRSRRTSQTAPMQLIHLDDGVTDLATGKVLQGSDADLKHASRLLSLHSAVRGHMEKQHKAGLQPRPKSRDREVPLERVANGWRTELGKHDRQTEQKKLDQTFVRDPPARALANGAKARDSVRDKLTTASAEDSPVATEAVDTSLSSVDELQGGNNIVSQALPSVSPNTKQSGAARAGTPSDLKPTKFTQSKKSTRSQQSAKEAVQQDDERMSVTPYAIYTVACCSVNRWGRIVYDARAKKLDIYDGDLPVVLPGGGGIVSIGPREAHRIYVNKDSNRVYLMGGPTQTSIGRICIAFKEYQDVEWFHERLMSVTEDSIAVSHLPYDKLETTFAHQAKDIQKAHDNKAKIRADQQTRKIGLHNGGGAESEDETIQYDDVTTEEQPVRTGRRDAMLAAHVKVPSAGPSAPAKDVRSHYFHQEGGATRRSTREKKFVQARVQTPSPERWSRLHNPKRWSKPVEYPQQSARRVTVDFGDIERLDEGQFLNDNLISFGLRKIQEEMAPEHRESVHFFNSFFYTSLTTKNGRKSLNYDSVKKWTKGKDLLSTPYVVVPINIDLHWYAAIICNLDQLIRQAGNDEEEERQGEDEFAYFEDDKPEMDAQPSREHPVADSTSSPTAEKLTDHTAEMKKLSLASSGPASPVDVEVFEFGEHGVVQPTSHHDAGATSTQPDSRPSTAATKAKKGGKKKFTPAPRRYSTDTPAIITLDSFGLPHTAEVRNLKEYIIREAEDKRGMLVDRDDLYGVSAKGIPQQANFCDCGVYLLAYVEQFAKDPRAFVEKVLSKAMEEDQEFAGFNPSGKRAEIRNVLLGLNETQEAARKEMKKAKSGEKKVEAADTAAVPAAAAAAEKRPVGKAADMKSAAASDLPPAESAPVLEGASNTRPSAETSAPSLPVEARKASKPAKMAETAASNTKSPAWNIEEGDELDVAPARPLAQAAVSDPMEPAAVHAVHNVDPTRFHDFDEEEMLDGNTDPNADNSSALNVEPAHLGKDLLAPLEDVLVQNGGTEARAATTKSLSPETKQSLSEVQAEEDLVEQGSQQPLELSSRLAEVADSQEEVRVVAAAPKRAGTHTKFVA